MGMPGMQELLIILVLVLIIFGAGKLPQVGGQLGKGLRNFKDGMRSGEDEENIEEAKRVEDDSDDQEKKA
jgi:sec-independent protein translocase protein TatA